jgi:hypothetical protein
VETIKLYEKNAPKMVQEKVFQKTFNKGVLDFNFATIRGVGIIMIIKSMHPKGHTST